MDTERYARHLVLKEIGTCGQEKLLSSRVLIVGAGGLGSINALYLAAAGVGTIGLCDDDKVELTNLQRQIIHSVCSVGEAKTHSAERAISALNPSVKTELFDYRVTTKNVLDLIGGFDLVLDCVDRFESKFLLSDACVLKKKPFVHAGVVGMEGQVMTYKPGFPCLRCLLGEVPHGAATCATLGVLGSVVGLIGCIQATEAIKLLVGREELLTGKVLKVDALNMKFRTFDFGFQSESCAVCSSRLTDLTGNEADYTVN